MREDPITSEAAACEGECRECGVSHRLSVGNARVHARELMREFEEIQRLDYLAPVETADPELSFEHLFPGGHGNMFGVLECQDAEGRTVVLRAFSSLRRGIRDINGWVAPILSADCYYGTIVPTQRKIEEFTAQLERLDSASPEYHELKSQRSTISRALLAEMKAGYRFHNFRGQERSLDDAIWPAQKTPGGVGECCAPKLLDHAAQHGLRPRGLAEFYWGDSITHVAGNFYPSCQARCQPILGFMLCGLDQ
ncbi:MAG: hypothetical protein VCC04_01030 [Myxococcota bacterium]